MCETNKIIINKKWREALEKEHVELINGNVEDWLEHIFANQCHAYEYYDVAHSQLILQQLNVAKKFVNEIIESIKNGLFRTNVRANIIKKLIDVGNKQKREYNKLQSLFKQHGSNMAECLKIIYYLDEVTAKTDNKIKTILEYYNSLKINILILKGKLALDTLNWEDKRKMMISDELNSSNEMNSSSESERQITVEFDEDESEKVLITFH